MLTYLLILALIKLGHEQWIEDKGLIKLVRRYWQFRLFLARFTKKKKSPRH